jgi:hypothetical protein
MFKKLFIVLVCVSFLSFGCGRPKVIDGIRYKTVGIFQREAPGIVYEVSFGNVFWSIIFIETIVIPVYFIGWSIKNPVCSEKCYKPGVDECEC